MSSIDLLDREAELYPQRRAALWRTAKPSNGIGDLPADPHENVYQSLMLELDVQAGTIATIEGVTA
jgi:hypothetical protein